MIEKIKDYKIVNVVGKGGMGEVYLAIHPTLKREIILKRLGTKNIESSKRFLQEAKIMLEFRHENIVQFYDHFKDGNSTYIAMEYVKGKPLNQIIEENESIPIPIALFIVYQIALGLYHAHQKQIIHRDIKPHNILISAGGDIKITDFGIATTMDKTMTEVKTGSHEIIGTPAYMAPEQFSRDQVITNRTDIYALGVIFFEMITGVRPYRNEFSPELIASIVKASHAPVNRYINDVPHIVNKVLSKTFNPKENKRYKTLYPLIKLLRNYFKRFNRFEINDSIVRLVKKDKKLKQCSFISTYNRKTKITSIVRKIALITFLSVFLGYLFFSTNRYYEWIFPNKYGKIILEFPTKDLVVDNTYLKVDNKYYKANLKPAIKINFNNPFKRKKIINKKFIEFINMDIYSKSYYVEKGEREVAVLSGSYKQIKRVVVMPRTLQNNNKATKDGQRVYIPNVGIWSQDVICYFRFWDSLKSENLLFTFNNYSDRELRKYERENSFLKIYYRNRYINLKDYILMIKRLNANPFVSGNRYSFMVKDFKKDNIEYFNKYFNVKISLDERTIILHQSLIPKPSKIRIISNKSNLPVIINNDNKGLLFIKNDYEYNPYKKINYRKAGNKFICELLIPPQLVQLKIGNKGKVVKKFFGSNEELEITVNYEKGKYIY
ncbi:MAG: serine/threonine protein kinase [Spirochaetes bacterium]|nr:serine/threonine protein kinase [Spirochaetota bacterium]